jgi:hypothetical protein
LEYEISSGNTFAIDVLLHCRDLVLQFGINALVAADGYPPP